MNTHVNHTLSWVTLTFKALQLLFWDMYLRCIYLQARIFPPTYDTWRPCDKLLCMQSFPAKTAGKDGKQMNSPTLRPYLSPHALSFYLPYSLPLSFMIACFLPFFLSLFLSLSQSLSLAPCQLSLSAPLLAPSITYPLSSFFFPSLLPILSLHFSF